MWRDLRELLPSVGVDRSGALSSYSRTVPMGAVAVPLTGVPAVEASPASTATPSTCATFGCDDPVFSPLTGRCEPHDEERLDRRREYLDDVDRGSFAS